MICDLLQNRRNALRLAIAFTFALMPAFGQKNGVDTAVLAKATSGDARSQVLVGESFAAGNGGAHDYKQAADWYRKAADQRDASGEVHLAALYRDGKGVAQDMKQAADWYSKAAEQGDSSAQGTIGVLYAMGQGVPRDDMEAYYWLDLAAAVKGPDQEKYVANRQNVGARITADELATIQEREVIWKAAHPR
jgi:TPR repeat protein